MKKILLPLAFIFCLSLTHCDLLGGKIVKLMTRKYETEEKIFKSDPAFIGEDANRERILISLNEVTTVNEPTDIQFPPSDARLMFILEKKGNLILFDRRDKKSRIVLTLPVLTESELGLLGLAFHPNYPKEPLVYLNYTKDVNGDDTTIVSEWQVASPTDFGSLSFQKERILLQVYQPFPNHNAGQLAFGKDNYLYVGLGDGGLRGDPKNHAQNTKTLLGSMLRIDPKADVQNKKPYSIPRDNPFVGNDSYLPEIYAYGLRNPWRYSFSPTGQLLVADVGQDKFEEVDIIESGKNYGWNLTEGFHCYTNKCDVSKFAAPIYEYGREEGQSITGGYVYSAGSIDALKGKYVFGDFISGKIWAFDATNLAKNKVEKVYALGKWNVLISTFGRDEQGDVFVGDYQSGKIFKIIAQSK
jgi:glucose/arabinose dehydrogenase